jgi:hypothetical protein
LITNSIKYIIALEKEAALRKRDAIVFHDHDDGVSEIRSNWSNAHFVDPRENATVTER